MNVVSVEAKGEKAAILVMDDGSKVWTPEKEKADALVGKPIPSDWTIKKGDYGPQAFPPRAQKGFGGGGAAAFRNTKEGQAVEQERMDRRTALMQAVIYIEHAGASRINEHGGAILDGVANSMYDWLRETSGVAATPIAGPTSPAPAPSSATTADYRQPQPSRDEGADSVVGGRARDRIAQSREEVRPGAKDDLGDSSSAGPSPTTEQAGVLPAEGGASVCSHPSDKVVLTSPAGSPLPKNYWRCEACGLVGRDAK